MFSSIHLDGDALNTLEKLTTQKTPERTERKLTGVVQNARLMRTTFGRGTWIRVNLLDGTPHQSEDFDLPHYPNNPKNMWMFIRFKAIKQAHLNRLLPVNRMSERVAFMNPFLPLAHQS